MGNTSMDNEAEYDAIVIGSGISGGYAAMELSTKFTAETVSILKLIF